MTFPLRSLLFLPLLVLASTSCKTSPKPTGELGYLYIAFPGDTIQDIAAAYRERGVEVTAEQIRVTNPRVKFLNTESGAQIWTANPGSRLFIPAQKREPRLSGEKL